MRARAISRYIIVPLVLMAGVIAPTPAPTGEYAPPDESAMMQRIVNSFQAVVRREFKKNGFATRDAHARGQGCVRADVSVAKSIPHELRHGVFSAPHTYRAWIRFSNGSGEIQEDNVPDGRGMAVKLTGVAGPKLIPDEKYTQDFVMIDFPVFFVSDVAEYAKLTNAIEHGATKSFFASHPRSAKLAAEIAHNGTHDLLRGHYFSMTPYLLGGTYVKFAALPVSCTTDATLHISPLAAGEGPEYLERRMSNHLARRSACFDLQLQPRTDPSAMPLENASVLWSTALAPFITVARITIPRQSFNSKAQQTFCEDLSFSPWHGTKDFRPVGGLNRLRLFVYRAISRLRHQLNRTKAIEPTGYEKFSPYY